MTKKAGKVKTITCPVCHGMGMVPCPDYHGFLGLDIDRCPTCKGKGKIVCGTCGGSKKIVVQEDDNR